MASSTSKKGGKKIGRGLRKPSHSSYVATNRKEINKARKIRKHLKQCDNNNDKDAIAALKRII